MEARHVDLQLGKVVAGVEDKMKNVLNCPICKKDVYSKAGPGCKMCGMAVGNSESFCCKICMRKFNTISKKGGLVK